MKTRALLLALPLLVLASCNAKRASVTIQQICVPTKDCTFGDTCDAQSIGFVTLDTSASAQDTLWLILQVANQAQDSTNTDTGLQNTKDAHIKETIVEYDGIALASPATITNFDVPAGGTAVVSALVIPPGLSSTLDAFGTAAGATGRQITARVRMRGYYEDGSRFETDEFPIGVRICSGCAGATCAGLPTCPPDSDGQLPVLCMDPETVGTTP